MFSFSSESPLPVSGAEAYRGMAFDGCRFYLTLRCECAAAVLDSQLCPVQTIKTRRPYTALCYDPRRSCFWALSDQCRSALFRLDRELREIDRLEPRLEGRCPGPFTGVSFCCDTGRLLVSRTDQLLDVDPGRGSAVPLPVCRGYTLILTALCLPPYRLFLALRGSAVHFVLADRDGRVLAEEKAPEGLTASALALDPCTYDLLLLTNRHGCYPYLLRVRLGERIRGSLCPCIRDLCRPCRQEHPCSCRDLLESIALEEAAVAHILNAEGEKLQKAVACSADPCTLLRINESIQRTIRYAAQLEQVLLSKLETVCSLCGPADRDGSPC